MVSDKQAKILKKAGFTAEEILAMPYEKASEKIGKFLESQKKKGPTKQSDGKTSQGGSKRGFEAHLSIEQTRTNALTTALEVLKSGVFKDGNLEDLAKRFEKYFLTGEF